jgi:hypothetical protein
MSKKNEKTLNVIINNEELAKVYGVKKGGTVAVLCRDGVPVVREWRNRFKDAEFDKCITIAKNTPKPEKGSK